MINNLKIYLIIGLIILFGMGMIGCDSLLETESNIDDVNLVVEEMEMEPMVGLQQTTNFRSSSLRFIVKGMDEGILSLSTETVDAVPARTEFTDGEVEIEELLTYSEDEVLLVQIKSLEGKIIKETSIELSESDADIEKIADQSVETLSETPIHSDHVTGFFVDQSFSSAFDDWIYLDAQHVRDFGPTEQLTLVQFLQDNEENSYYAVGDAGDGKYDTWARFKVVGSANLDMNFKGEEEGLYYEDSIYKFTDAMVDEDVYTHLRGDITFELVDKDDNAKIENGTIGFADSEKDTDGTGQATFEEITAGLHGYTIEHDDYVDLEVEADDENAIEIAQASQTVSVELEFTPMVDINESNIDPPSLSMEPTQSETTIVTTNNQKGNPIDLDNLSIVQNDGSSVEDFEWVEAVDIDYDYGNANQAQITITADNSNTGSADNLKILVGDKELTDSFELVVDYTPEISTDNSNINPDNLTMEPTQSAATVVTVNDQYGNSFAIEADDLSGSPLVDYDWVEAVNGDYEYGDDNQAQITITADDANTGSADGLEILAEDKVLTDSFAVEVDYTPAVDSDNSSITGAAPDPVTAGEEFTFEATLKDQYGNSYAGLNSSDFEIDDPEIDVQDVVEDGTTGIYTVTAVSEKAAEYSEVDVMAESTTIGNITTTVKPADINETESGVELVSDAEVEAGDNNVELKLTLKDEFGNNIVGNYGVMVKDGDWFDQQVDIDDNVLFSVTEANEYVDIGVKVEDNGNVYEIGQFSVTVIPAAADSITLNEYPDYQEIVIPGQGEEPTVEQFNAEVLDQYGNEIDSSNLNWELTAVADHLSENDVSIDQSGTVTVNDSALLLQQDDDNVGTENAFKVKADLDDAADDMSIDLVLAEPLYSFEFELGQDSIKRVSQLFYLRFELGDNDQYNNPRPEDEIFNILVESDLDGTVFDEEILFGSDDVYLEQISLDSVGEHVLTATVSFVAESEDTTVTVKKINPEETEDDAVSSTAVDADKTLAASDLSGTFVDPYSEETIEGTLEWSDDTEVVDATGDFEWIFTPDDGDIYNVKTGYVQVEVNN